MRLGWGLMACFGLPGATAQNCIQTAFFIVLQSNMKRAEKNELYRKRSPLFRLAGLRHKQVAWCSKRGAVWSSPCRKSDKSFSHHPRTSSQMSNIKKSCLSVKCSSLAWRHWRCKATHGVDAWRKLPQTRWQAPWTFRPALLPARHRPCWWGSVGSTCQCLWHKEERNDICEQFK